MLLLQAGGRLIQELQAGLSADAHADRARARRCFVCWKQAVSEGRVAVMEIEQQQATWGKINGWLAEVAAKQQAQAKVGEGEEVV
jgi:hypothetical protein